MSIDTETSQAIERNMTLCARFPFLMPRDWDDEIDVDYDYEWTYLDDMQEGWRDAFGVDMCTEIRDVLEKYDCLKDYRVLQVKEKYGGLRWYDGGHIPRKASEEIDDIIERYEHLSYRTCVVCGRPATRITKGWVSPYCNHCIGKMWANSIPIEEWLAQ